MFLFSINGRPICNPYFKHCGWCSVYTVSKSTLGVKKVAWPRKTASTTKRTDMGLWPRSICNHNTPCKIWDKKWPIRSFNFFKTNWKIYELNLMSKKLELANKSHKMITGSLSLGHLFMTVEIKM